MRGKRLGLCVAACAVASACGAGSAHAAYVFRYEGASTGIAYYAEAGEANDLKITTKVNPSSTRPGEFEPKVVTFEERGAPLSTRSLSSSQHACDQLTPQKVRCVTPDYWFTEVQVFLIDRGDKVRAVGAGLPRLEIDPGQSADGDRYTLSNGWVFGVGTHDRLRFRPPGGGGAQIGGRPFLWLADGAPEYLYCHGGPTHPILIPDPLDTWDREYC